MTFTTALVVFSLVSFCSVTEVAAIPRPLMQGVAREQKMLYEHMDMNKLANEFQLIDPSMITDNLRYGKAQADGKDYWVKPLIGAGGLTINNDDVVNVQYYSSSPNDSDWIAAFSPALTNYTTKVPVKFGMANISPDYMNTGQGTLQFNFTNLRADISFYFFSNGLKHPIAENSTVDQPDLFVDFSNYNEPLRPRMVPTGDYDKFQLLWSSNNSANPIVKWGTTPGAYNNEVDAETKYITQEDVCDGFGSKAAGVGWRDQGAIHTATLTGMSDLPAGSIIYYTFGDETITDGMSQEFLFNVPPQAGVAMDRPTTALLYCDLGRGGTDDAETWNAYGRPSINTTMSAAAMVNQGDVDVVFHGGDISYACGYEAVWDFFLDQLSPVASRVLYLTTVGNHESDWPNSASLYNTTDSGGECGVMTQGLIPMPAPATTDKPWWSYDVGLVHFVGMSTEHNFTECSEQYAFLEEDLRSVDRTVTPWIIFNGHRAMYVSSDFGYPYVPANISYSDGAVQQQLIENIEPLLYKYKVNAGFWGHNHVFQRQGALYNSTVVANSETIQNADGDDVALYAEPQATVQLVLGNAGANFSWNAVDPAPAWNEVTANFYGYSIVKAYNASYLTWDTVDSQTATGDVVRDRVVITQDPANLAQPWVLPDTEAFSSMPEPALAVCSNIAPVNPDVAPSSDSTDPVLSATVSAIIIIVAIAALGGVFWYVRVQEKAASDGHNKGNLIYPAGSVNKNPLIQEDIVE